MRNAIVTGAIALVVVLLVWSGLHNYQTRRAEEARLRQQQTNIRVDRPGATAALADDAASFGAATDLRGRKAAVFTLTTLDGKRVSLIDLKGKPVLLNFWATWCAPCKVEMPWFQEFQNKYAAQGLTVVGVNEDDDLKQKEIRDEVAATAKRLGVTYPILLSDHKVGDAYGGLDQLPATFFIDKTGVIRAEAIGLASKDEAEANVQKILQPGS